MTDTNISKDMDYSEYTLEREGQRSSDRYSLTFCPKDSPTAVTDYVAPWVARLIKAALLDKCPENVIEHKYGYRRERAEHGQ